VLVLSLALLVAAVVFYVGSPSMLIYSTHPWPVYALLIASVAAAYVSRRRGLLRWLAIGGTTLVAAFFIVYTAYLSRLAPPELALKAGDAFPEFTLQTSTGELFSPTQLKGKKAALYVFYRGDW
jgi:hypothetical protein